MRGHRDLSRVTVAAVVCALVASLFPWEAVRLVAALPLAVFLPGYAIVVAAFGPHRLDPQRLIMLLLACGLSALCLGGLVLDYLPGGLRTATWALLLTLIVIVFSRVAAIRRPRPAPAGRARSPFNVRPVDVACCAAALAALVGALVLAFTPLPAGKATGYTSLWMLPGRGAAAPAVRVGVSSAEQGPRSYLLLVGSDGSKTPRSYRVALDPGGERVFRVPVELKAMGPTRVVASLYKGPSPGDLYRRATTWLRPGEEGR